MEIQIIAPACSDDEVSAGLRELTKAIASVTPDFDYGFGLGGEYGYGDDFENDTFVMRRFYWGDCTCGFDDKETEWCDTHSHADECYQSELKRRKLASGLWRVSDEWSWLDKVGSYDECRAAEDRIFDALCKKYARDRKYGAAVHCTCDYERELSEWLKANSHEVECPVVAPNFKHKATGFEVRWYKYIGRDMEFEGECDWRAVLNDCLASLAA